MTMDIAERATQNFGGDRIYFYQLAVQNAANKITLLIDYEFRQVQKECVIYRTIYEPGGNATEFQPVTRISAPDMVELNSLIDDVRTAVRICIERITEKIQSPV